MNIKFEKAKLKRELKRSGKDYIFSRMGENEFGEKSEQPVEIGILNAIYHETNGHISTTKKDSTIYRKLKTPMLLCLYEDTTFLNVGDTTIINGKVVMKDRKILTVNEDEILRKSREVSANLWERLNR